MAVYIGSTAGYMRLDSWVMAKIIQLAVARFCRRYFNHTNDPCGRQYDQTTQAARAIGANIAEGSARHQTSVETEMRLLDVARASISEVIDDLIFILLDNNEFAWGENDSNAIQIRNLRLDKVEYGKSMLRDVTAHIQQQKAKFDPWLENPSLMVQANAIIVLCLRVIKMLRSQIGARLEQFKETGGFTENMTDTRMKAKRQQSIQSNSPECPICGAPMYRRLAKKGVHQGEEFWSCSNYFTTGCKATLPIT